MYTVQLTVYDSSGYSGTQTLYDYIQVEDTSGNNIIVDFIAASSDQSLSKISDVNGLVGFAPFTVQFLNLTTPDSIMPPVASNSPWMWNFGDGDTSNLKSPIYQYTTPGIYPVKLIVSSQESDGTTTNQSRIRYDYITVLDPNPQAAFDIIPAECAVSATVCTVTVHDRSFSYNDIVEWNWDFGDGSSELKTNTPYYTHLYTNVDIPKTINITLTIIDVEDSSDTIVKSLNVKSEIIYDVKGDYSSIQDAINAVPDNLWTSLKVIIEVDTGVYFENIDLKGKSLTIRPKKGHDVIIDGAVSDSVIKIMQGETACLEDLTIQNGKAEYGGGILIDNSSNVIINNCKIINNQATIAGGGIAFLNNSYGVIDNTVIGEDSLNKNAAPYGAGIACLYDASPLITGQTTISYNEANINGGGLFTFLNANPVIMDTFFYHNTANNGSGGGIYASQSEPRIETSHLKNNLASKGAGIAFKNTLFPIVRRSYIQSNVAGSSGGGIYGIGAVAPQIINALIADNRATNGSGFYFNATSSANILFSTIANNTAVSGTGCGIYGVNMAPSLMVMNSIFKNQGGEEVVLSDSEPAWISNSVIVQTKYNSDSNISADPKFLVYGTSTPDYHLDTGSPCQESAQTKKMVQRDLDGNNRYIGNSGDMGAFESGTWPITVLYDNYGKVIGPNTETIASGSISGIEHQDTKSFTVMPLTGYFIHNVLVDGVSVLDQMTVNGDNMIYTFTNVTAPHTFQANFSRKVQTVSIQYQGDFNSNTTNPLSAEVDMTAESEDLLKQWPLPGVIQQLTVYHGSDLTLTAKPAMSTELISFSSGQSLDSQSVLISNVTENMSITIVCALKKFNISLLKAGDGSGVIQSTSSQVKYGENITLTAIPDVGKSQFDGWSGFVSSTSPVISIDNIQQNITLTGTFNLKTLIVKIHRNSTGGSLSGFVNTSTNISDQLVAPDIDMPDGKTLLLKYGDDLKLTAITPGNWKFDGWTWTGNGDGNETFTTHEWLYIQTDMSVTAQFSPNIINVSILKNPLSTGSGVIYVNDIAQSLPTTLTVPYGGSLTARPVPDTYSSVFVGWSGDATGTGNAVLTNMTSNKSIYSNFQLKTFSIIASATSGGSINPTGMSALSYGQSKIFSFAPDGSDAFLSDLLIDNVSIIEQVGQITTYTFSDISANHTIEARFNRQLQVGNGGYSTIQKAIDVSIDGDTILVKPGIYEENISFNGKAVHVESEIPYQAIIDGQYAASVVRFVSNEPAGAILSGFIIRHGTGSTGGGLYIDNASPTIKNCRIENNLSLFHGGGIYIIGSSSPLITSSTIQHNTSGGSGAGIYCDESSPTLFRSLIVSNKAHRQGGALYASGTGNPSLVNMVIYDNYAGYNGGAIAVENSPVMIKHCTVSDNQAGQGSDLFVGNMSPDDKVVVQNSILWQNNTINAYLIDSSDDSIQIAGSNVYMKNGTFPGEGNINQNPLFASFHTGNYHIKNGSPCINAGLSLDQDTVSIDYDGYPRPYSNQVDMGAFEWNDSVLQVDFYASVMSGTPGMEVNFNGHAFSGVGGYIWDWDFGNVTTASVQNPITIMYSQPGLYNVRLTVTDNNGSGQTITREKTIIVKQKPSADFIVSTSYGFVPLKLEFTDTSQSSQSLVAWEWDFGDGTQSFLKNPTHTYTIPGTYTVKLLVIDMTNQKDTSIKYQHITVVDSVPQVNFTAKNSLGNAPLTVQFYDTTSAYNHLKSWLWNFGDNSTSTLQHPVHTFTHEMDYTISLTVKDDKGSYLEFKQNYIHVSASSNKIEVCPTGCDFDTIQDAIDGAADGDIITVHDGLYSENISFKGKNIKLISSNGPFATSISAQLPGSVVTFNQGESNGALLQGFTLTNGKARFGGGILIANSSSPCISNCIINNNIATSGGGG